MFNTAHLLTNVASVNNFTVVPILDLRADSSPVDVFFQLWQTDLGTRYIPAAGASTTLKVEFLRSDTVAPTPVSQTVSQMASQPFTADDRSIWKITLASADVAKVVSGGYRLTLTETINAVVVTTVLFVKCTIRKLPSSGDPL